MSRREHATQSRVDGDVRPRLRIYYHVFHPSDNVSARHFSDLAAGLARRGWNVTACPSNRNYPDGSVTYPTEEAWKGLKIQRIWRPNCSQSVNMGRLVNAIWMILIWSMQALRRRKARPNVVVIGTDPILSVLCAITWKFVRPKTAIAHWGFDLYPEAPIADGMISPRSPLVQILKILLRAAYRACDLIVDIGPCMYLLIAKYGSSAKTVTLTPWALVEPAAPVAADPKVRHDLFGNARLGILYSGTFGRAHSYEEFLALARALRNEPIGFCFAGRGNRAEQLRKAVTAEDTNIRFAGFASEAELEKRLGAADIHMASLRPEWTGTVVPSKFFGSLAAGRPVLFAGAPESALAIWIQRHQVGWRLDNSNQTSIATSLKELLNSTDDLDRLKKHCHSVYQENFAREHVIDQWDRELRLLI